MAPPLRHVTVIRPSRELCGTTEEQFGELLAALAPLAEEDKRLREERPDRKRRPGAGMRPRPFWLRLLVALTHLRQGSSVRATAATFGVHERSVRRWRDEVERLLVAHGFRPPGATRPIRSLEDLDTHLRALPEQHVLVDGTEVPRSSPGEWEAMKAAYSGKSRRHVAKGTVVADQSRRPVWFEADPAGEGRTHDLTMLRSQLGLLAVLAATAVTVVADQAYRGLPADLGDGALVPIMKPRRRAFDPADAMWNKEHSRLRVPVEHAIGRMKWWRAMHEWRRPVEHFDRGGKAVGVLASIL
jgi:transposase-like protein